MVKAQNNSKNILRVAIPDPFYQLFDYLAPDNVAVDRLKPGIRLIVPFGRQKKIAFLLECSAHSDWALDKLKPVEKILDAEPLLSTKDLALLHWASQYYHHPVGEVLSTAFPTALRQGKDAIVQTTKYYSLTAAGAAFDCNALKRTPKQKALLEKFQSQQQPLSETELAAWNESYRTALKPLIAKALLQLADKPDRPKTSGSLIKSPALAPNAAQQAAIHAVCASLGQFKVFLLEGVTGSGKTEVYLQIIHEALQKGQQVLVLVPEITLTPQLAERFQQRFAVDIALSHSKLTDKQRQKAWLKIQQGESRILLGTRSALFTPFKNLGLIILDEEHDSSFKQQEGFRFSARDVAIMRGKLASVPVLLGSATPSLESLHNIKKQRYQLLHLPERAGNAVAPLVQLMDIRNKPLQEGLSQALIREIQACLAQNEQVLLFLNRRGFAPTLICHSCAWVARCLSCDANLVIHYDENLLRCHHCGKEHQLVKHCPACKTGGLTPLGLGTERVEKALAEIFSDKTTLRIDRDSTQRKGTLENYLEQINLGKVDIILGTQMLAKGHHFPNVTLVAILDVDSGLFSIDFHSAEKLAQLVIQVAGRAGRAEKRGKVILQTRQPDHPLLTTLINQGYQSFAQTALAERELAQLPPFSFQALLRVEAMNQKAPQQFLQAVVELIQSINKGQTQLFGPVSAPMAKRAGFFRYQLLLQSAKRKDLHVLLEDLMPAIAKLKQAQKVRCSLDVDPVDLY